MSLVTAVGKYVAQQRISGSGRSDEVCTGRGLAGNVYAHVMSVICLVQPVYVCDSQNLARKRAFDGRCD
jgi:hypothetical protein